MGIMIVELYDALKEAGASDEKAKAAAGSIPVKDELATKSDVAKLQADLAKLRAEIYRQLWLAAISIVLATVALTGTLIKLIL